jgi:hypothetical protein
LLAPHGKHSAALQIRTGAEWEPQAAPPREWSYRACAGRLVELSGSHAAPLLSLAFVLVADAQRAGEPVAWIQGTDSTFFPPDAARNGVDLGALVVVRLAEPSARMRAAVRLLRSGAFGLVAMDLGGARPGQPPPGGSAAAHAPPAPPSAGREAQTAPPSTRREAQTAPPGARREAQTSPLGTSPSAPGQPRREAQTVAQSAPPWASGRPRLSAAASPALLGKLGQLAQQHDTAVCCLTVKRPEWASLGALVSLRGEALRRHTGEDRFACTVRVLKDKRNAPGWTHEEAMRGAPGLP